MDYRVSSLAGPLGPISSQALRNEKVSSGIVGMRKAENL